MEKLRLGIVGCGKMMRAHVESLSEVEEVEITAFCDILIEQAKDFAQIKPDAYVTTDWKTMTPYVDAVLVALPHDLHYECGMFFARNKKHILMEKTLCNSEEKCLRLIQACEDEGVVLQCAYPVRHWPGIVKLKEMVDSGEYGQIMQMSVWTEQLTKYDSETIWKAPTAIGKMTQFEIRHFANCVRTGETPLIDGKTALKSLQVIWKMYDAEKHHTVADLTDIKMN